VRRLAVELRPKVLDDFGLVPALERLTGAFAEQTGIEVDLEAGAIATGFPAEAGDRDLPHRPGVAHERRQALPRAAGERARDALRMGGSRP
jgi:hypothetical protein